jgi:hypothetical protein
MEPGEKNSAFKNGIARAIKSLKWPMLLAMQNLAVEARALRVIISACNAKLGMGERSPKARHRHRYGGQQRPIVPTRDETSKDTRIIGVIGNGERRFHEIVECS